MNVNEKLDHVLNGIFDTYFNPETMPEEASFADRRILGADLLIDLGNSLKFPAREDIKAADRISALERVRDERQKHLADLRKELMDAPGQEEKNFLREEMSRVQGVVNRDSSSISEQTLNRSLTLDRESERAAFSANKIAALSTAKPVEFTAQDMRSLIALQEQDIHQTQSENVLDSHTMNRMAELHPSIPDEIRSIVTSPDTTSDNEEEL